MVVFIIIAVLAATVLPQLWIRYTISRHGADQPDLPGTGGKLARHLLDRFDLNGVTVETTDSCAHYEPEAKAVRLLKQHHDGRSFQPSPLQCMRFRMRCRTRAAKSYSICASGSQRLP